MFGWTHFDKFELKIILIRNYKIIDRKLVVFLTSFNAILNSNSDKDELQHLYPPNINKKILDNFKQL